MHDALGVDVGEPQEDVAHHVLDVLLLNSPLLRYLAEEFSSGKVLDHEIYRVYSLVDLIELLAVLVLIPDSAHRHDLQEQPCNTLFLLLDILLRECLNREFFCGPLPYRLINL